MLRDKSIKDIEKILLQGLLSPGMVRALRNDPRKGVNKLYQRWCQKQQQDKEEQERLAKLLAFDAGYLPANGFLAGVDEAGRGPLAGPVVAAAVILPTGVTLPLGTDDSKRLNAPKREYIAKQIKHLAFWAVGVIPPQIIDEINIHQATLRAMETALSTLCEVPEIILIDGIHTCRFPSAQIKVVKGDQKSAAIACASIIAKVERDSIMRKYSQIYPQYGFDRHFGYPTEEHRKAVIKYGVSSIHRCSFSGVKECL
ncbi:ribonuclease HII [Metallumcola ferriviriculae]|uniref:Ribonuclease HII n=1 Tax=Metallumcola ferriviriculae TaxID=3039180 RepID=A0AAU0UPU8_9FIRM|nr:ribonuclease HII [Desulfitibacteraceae bacterium MK1]